MNNSKYKSKVDHIFWFTLMVFTNPAGILNALGFGAREGGIHITDLLFLILFICLIIVHKTKLITQDKNFNNLVKRLFLFLIYYLILFAFFIPQFKNSSDYSPISAFIKCRHGVYNIFLVVMIYEFYIRNHILFLKYFLFFSISGMSLFLITVITGLDILPILQLNRNFVDTKRLFMESYGIMPILIPMGVSLLVFKFSTKFRIWIIIGALLMYLMWILAIIRREIFGTILFLLMVMIFSNFLHRKSLIPVKKIIGGLISLTILIFVLNFTFPEYVKAGELAAEEVIYILKTGKKKSGGRDARLGMGKEVMQNTIKEHYIFGTGFDNRWRTREGDDQGFEAADYPFLSAIAMNGIIGILFFLPIYIILIRTMHYDIVFLRSISIDLNSLHPFMLITFLTYFIFDLLQYFNWFLPMSLFLQSEHKRWFIFLGLYFGVRRLFYGDINNRKILGFY